MMVTTDNRTCFQCTSHDIRNCHCSKSLDAQGAHYSVGGFSGGSIPVKKEKPAKVFGDKSHENRKKYGKFK